MAKYVMMIAPRKNEYDISPEIRIIDNSRLTGKKKVEALCYDGWTQCGTIESDLKPAQITVGIRRPELEKRDEMQLALFEISRIAQRGN